jgi:hypothetical protein
LFNRATGKEEEDDHETLHTLFNHAHFASPTLLLLHGWFVERTPSHHVHGGS